jgi:hypothetical protein
MCCSCYPPAHLVAVRVAHAEKNTGCCCQIVPFVDHSLRKPPLAATQCTAAQLQCIRDNQQPKISSTAQYPVAGKDKPQPHHSWTQENLQSPGTFKQTLLHSSIDECRTRIHKEANRCSCSQVLTSSATIYTQALAVKS